MKKQDTNLYMVGVIFVFKKLMHEWISIYTKKRLRENIDSDNP